ncbi:MAG TPA: hypothetical protein VFS60_10775 [Thermoanaerobaculia bacterium]|nr:hypothetical protein [Thermoanaerobaculia bacterium]
MSALLLRVETIERTGLGIRLTPGVRFSQAANIPELQTMQQGSPLELRKPDGTLVATQLVTYGIAARQEGELLYSEGDANEPEVFLFLPPDLADDALPRGTEVWLVSHE